MGEPGHQYVTENAQGAMLMYVVLHAAHREGAGRLLGGRQVGLRSKGDWSLGAGSQRPVSPKTMRCV